jgi:hypothetical protein
MISGVAPMSLKLLQPVSRQAGQALPLVAIFMLVLCVGLLITFDTGQMVSKKVELTHAADAAAYSVAVEQARARNMAAYLNRGRVANEIAIAQMVSLNSWLAMVHSTSDRFGDLVSKADDILFWVPYLGQILTAIDKATVMINEALVAFREVFIPGSNGFIFGIDGMDFIYAEAARAALSGVTTSLDIPQMAKKVISDNSPNASLTFGGASVLLGNISSANQQLTLYGPKKGQGNGRGSSNDGGDRYRNVVMASRDTFTRARQGGAIWFFGGGFAAFNYQGGTDQVEYDRWSAVDTFSFHVATPPLTPNIDYSMGWGGAQATNDNKQPAFFPGMNRGQGWKSPYENRKSPYPAYNGAGSNRISTRTIESDPAVKAQGFSKGQAYLSGYRNGLAMSYYDVKGDAKKIYSRTPEGVDAGPIYTVEVEIDASRVRTSSILGIGTGRMQLKGGANGGKLRAMASAQVYFNRPHEYAPFRRLVWGSADNKFEMGSMFSPYWQARLVETPAGDKNQLLLASAL